MQTLIPIETIDDLKTLKEGYWLYDKKIVKRRKHGRSLTYEEVEEERGFVKIHVLDLDAIKYSGKIFMLHNIDGECRWDIFEPNRYFRVISIEILESTDGIQYGVHYPEYPNVVGGGIILEEAIEELKSNIKVYFEYLEEDQQ